MKIRVNEQSGVFVPGILGLLMVALKIPVPSRVFESGNNHGFPNRQDVTGSEGSCVFDELLYLAPQYGSPYMAALL